MLRIRWAILCALTLILYLGTAGHRSMAADTIGTIRRVDPRFDELVPKGAKLERLASGFEWSEGPVWDKRGQYLLFSDVPKNVVLKWQPGAKVVTFLKPSGYTGTKHRIGEPGSNGLLIDPNGRLILCQHGDRRVARLEADGKFTTLADRYEGKRFNSPNDLALKSNGDLYFTDPPYGLEARNDDPAKELPFSGVYRLSKDGQLTLLAKELTYPNGLAFSPDEKTLYIAQSDPNAAVWYAFDVKSDGTLGRSRVFFDATRWAKEGQKGLPDGLKVDRRGNLFATGPGGVHIFTPIGELLGSIDPGEATANCGWGGDGSMLYVAADMNLCRIQTNTRGAGF